MARIQVSGALAFVLILGVSCSKSVDTTDSGVQGTWSSLYSKVFVSECKNCHQPGGSSTVSLDFTSSSTGYNTLVNVAVQIPSSTNSCPGVYRILPNYPNKSFLMGNLFSDYNTNNFAGVSGCQPLTTHYGVHNISLSSTVKQAIINWINAGASQ